MAQVTDHAYKSTVSYWIGRVLTWLSVAIVCALIVVPLIGQLFVWLLVRFPGDQIWGLGLTALFLALFAAAFGDAFKRDAKHWHDRRCK